MTVVTMAVMAALFAPVAVLLRRRLPGHHGLSVVIDRLYVADLRGRWLPGNHGWLVARDRVLVIRDGIGVGCIGWWHGSLLRIALVGDARTGQTARARAENGTVAATHGLANGGAGYSAHTGTQKGVHIVCMGLGSYARQGACQ